MISLEKQSVSKFSCIIVFLLSFNDNTETIKGNEFRKFTKL